MKQKYRERHYRNSCGKCQSYDMGKCANPKNLVKHSCAQSGCTGDYAPSVDSKLGICGLFKKGK